MPPNRNNAPRLRRGGASEPPEVMTRPKSMPVIIVAVISDALRLMFVGFIFFGPAMADLYCDYTVSGWIGSAFGLTKAACASGAVAAGSFGAPALIAFGTVMAMAVGFAGWLAVGGWLMATNARIFKENALWFVGSLLFSEVPFIGAIPAITITVWKMHSHQIKIEEAAYKKWQDDNAAAQAQERSRQAAMTARQAQVVQQEAFNQERSDQLAKQEEQQAMDEEISRKATAEAGVQPLDAPVTTTPSPRLVAVPNYAGPSKNSNPKNKEIHVVVRKAA